MTYDLYFHNDFDGRASAAVLLSWFSMTGDKAGGYFPLDYTVKKEWVNEGFFVRYNPKGKKNGIAIVDFLYHPQAGIWFDHHGTTFLARPWEKKFRDGPTRAWNQKEPSCCGMIVRYLEKTGNMKFPAHIRELASGLDIADSAAYRSAAQTIELKEPFIQLGMYIEAAKNRGPLQWIVKAMSEAPMAKIARDPRVAGVVRRLKSRQKEELKHYKMRGSVEGNTIVTDLRGYQGSDWRFAPYYQNPGIRYGITIKRKTRTISGESEVYHISAGVNPWRKKENKVNIGDILRRYGGGGHKDVGGLELYSKDAAEAAIREIADHLNIYG